MFPCSPAPDQVRRSPDVNHVGFSLRVVLPLQSSFAISPARSLSRASSLPEFRPSSRHHSRASTHSREDSSLATFRPRVLTTPRRFSPLSSSGACFIPEPRPGHTPRPGASPSAQRLSVSSTAAAPLPLSSRRSSGRSTRSPHPGRLGFEALLHAETRSHRLGVTRTGGRSPLRVPLLQVLHPPVHHRLPGDRTLVAFLDPAFARALAISLAYSAFLQKDRASLSPGPPTCPSFRACPVSSRENSRSTF